ncbi:MAG: tRNA (adenosine(37)-N6)-threonylcarbamoyltransferase complex ATPase subunit type 1 TsaE [Candidatus Paceibacterota bacterium]
MLEILSHSSRETKKNAKILAAEILSRSFKPSALVIGLSGDLGAGKTTFIQGFAKGLGIKNKVLSPTFVIFKRFKIHDSRFKNLYHIDCYRLRKPKELLDLGFEEIINNPRNIVLIEWADKIKKILPKKTIRIEFEYGKKENERKITAKLK